MVKNSLREASVELSASCGQPRRRAQRDLKIKKKEHHVVMLFLFEAKLVIALIAVLTGSLAAASAAEAACACSTAEARPETSRLRPRQLPRSSCLLSPTAADERTSVTARQTQAIPSVGETENCDYQQIYQPCRCSRLDDYDGCISRAWRRCHYRPRLQPALSSSASWTTQRVVAHAGGSGRHRRRLVEQQVRVACAALSRGLLSPIRAKLL